MTRAQNPSPSQCRADTLCVMPRTRLLTLCPVYYFIDVVMLAIIVFCKMRSCVLTMLHLSVVCKIFPQNRIIILTKTKPRKFQKRFYKRQRWHNPCLKALTVNGLRPLSKQQYEQLLTPLVLMWCLAEIKTHHLPENEQMHYALCYTHQCYFIQQEQGFHQILIVTCKPYL